MNLWELGQNTSTWNERGILVCLEVFTQHMLTRALAAASVILVLLTVKLSQVLASYSSRLWQQLFFREIHTLHCSLDTTVYSSYDFSMMDLLKEKVRCCSNPKFYALLLTPFLKVIKLLLILTDCNRAKLHKIKSMPVSDLDHFKKPEA